MKKAIIFALTGLALVVTSFYSPIVCAEDTEDFLFQKNVTYSGVEGGKQGDNWKYPQFVGEKAVDMGMYRRDGQRIKQIISG